MPATVVGTVLAVGLLIWLFTHAAGSFVTIEPENGAVGAPALKATDSTASGGSAVRFGPEPSVPPTGNGDPTVIKIGGWNVKIDNPRDVAAEMKDLMGFADILGIQELSDTTQRNRVQSQLLCSSCDYDSNWTSHTYDSSSPNKEVIIWKKARFTELASGTVDISPRTTVEGGEVVAPRFTTWAKLQEKTSGKQFYVLNQHVVSGVEDNGKPISSVPKRLALYRTHMDKLTAKITEFKQQNTPIFITGDFNVDYRYDHTVKNSMFPYVRLGNVGAKSSYDLLNLAGISSGQGTRPVSARLIDYVWTVVRSDVAFKSEDISSSTHGSDHYAFFTDIELK